MTYKAILCLLSLVSFAVINSEIGHLGYQASEAYGLSYKVSQLHCELRKPDSTGAPWVLIYPFLLRFERHGYRRIVFCAGRARKNEHTSCIILTMEPPPLSCYYSCVSSAFVFVC